MLDCTESGSTGRKVRSFIQQFPLVKRYTLLSFGVRFTQPQDCSDATG
jgi:hypothetical protein